MGLTGLDAVIRNHPTRFYQRSGLPGPQQHHDLDQEAFLEVETLEPTHQGGRPAGAPRALERGGVRIGAPVRSGGSLGVGLLQQLPHAGMPEGLGPQV